MNEHASPEDDLFLHANRISFEVDPRVSDLSARHVVADAKRHMYLTSSRRDSRELSSAYRMLRCASRGRSLGRESRTVPAATPIRRLVDVGSTEKHLSLPVWSVYTVVQRPIS